MRAISISRFGGPDVLDVVDVERPEPGPTEVLVRVHAAGVNPVDWKTRAGHGFASPADLPFVPGWDVSGVVEAVAPGVTRFRPGDEVYGMPRFPNPAGAYAEYITAPARQLAAKPLNLDHAHAAAVPVAGLTAWQVLVDTAGVGPGHRVVIHGAAGGVGHLAVQIAKARGAHVTATGRRERRRFLERLGADEVLDAGRVDFTRAVRDVDVVLDLVGGEDAARSMAPLRYGGMLIPMATGGLDLRAAAAARGVRAVTFLVEPDYASLERLTGLIVGERMTVEVEAILPLAEAPHAHELGERGGRKGKIVLAVA
jgi:NADPH:quinone reductase-like Zn-dependent oxidoreductase